MMKRAQLDETTIVDERASRHESIQRIEASRGPEEYRKEKACHFAEAKTVQHERASIHEITVCP